jgi:hypothetical protein
LRLVFSALTASLIAASPSCHSTSSRYLIYSPLFRGLNMVSAVFCLCSELWLTRRLLLRFDSPSGG